MTVNEAHTIWLTMLGSGWVNYVDLLQDPNYHGTLDEAYVLLRDSDALEKDLVKQRVKIKCES